MKIMVSACLLGDNVKYNGGNNLNSDLINDLSGYEIIKVCPETFGNLKIPRSPSEIVNDKVLSKEGNDVTNNFILGANKTLEIAKANNIKVEKKKKNSPSCGSGTIYDGTFTSTLINGDGITSKLLKENGIIVLNEDNYKEYLKGVKNEKK